MYTTPWLRGSWALYVKRAPGIFGTGAITHLEGTCKQLCVVCSGLSSEGDWCTLKFCHENVYDIGNIAIGNADLFKVSVLLLFQKKNKKIIIG